MKSFLKLCVLSIMLVTTSSYALAKPQPVLPVGPYPRLNKVQFEVMSEQWVSTDTAKVTARVDANLNQGAMDDLQSSVLNNLKKLSKTGDWRITQFSRFKDQSDLEKVHIEAEARLPETELANIRKSAEGLSKPGMKYSIASIEYSPSIQDVDAVLKALREDLYSKVKQEIDSLNKVYSGQQFYVHKLLFGIDGQPPRPMSRMLKQADGVASAAPQMMSYASQSGGSNLSVSKKITMTASVVAASTIE